MLHYCHRGPVVHICNPICMRWSVFTFSIYARVLISYTEAILGIRTFALYERSLRILSILALVYMAAFGYSMVRRVLMNCRFSFS